MNPRLKFCGAAGIVTGSCTEVVTAESRFLVDCGMFQGTKTVKELNYGDFPFAPDKIDFVLLTHAHIDHAGLLPKLFKQGFRGPVHMTRATRDLLGVMLPDSGYIQEMEVEHLNRRNARRGRPMVEPIYTRRDAEDCQALFQALDYETWLDLPGLRAKFWNAGHILGSSSIEVELTPEQAGEKPLRLLWSGDLGPNHKLFHPDPDASADYDYVICESTYGGRQRVHAAPADRRRMLAREVTEALDAGGLLLIPSFAVERTQELLVDLLVLRRKGEIDEVPIYLDSPLAIRATEVFRQHADELEDVDQELDELFVRHVRCTQSAEDSKQINNVHKGAIIMAGSGMCDAGRIRHHLKHRLWHGNTTLLLVGYQAEGTLGRLLLDGADRVRIQGEEIEVRAKIRQLEVYSGHADESELVDWLVDRQPLRRGLFLTHGEEKSIAALRQAVIKRGFDPDLIAIPAIDDEIVLSDQAAPGDFIHKTRRAPQEALSGLDWHNDLAELQLGLKQAFDKAADKKARKALVRRLWRAIRHK